MANLKLQKKLAAAIAQACMDNAGDVDCLSLEEQKLAKARLKEMAEESLEMFVQSQIKVRSTHLQTIISESIGKNSISQIQKNLISAHQRRQQQLKDEQK